METEYFKKIEEIDENSNFKLDENFVAIKDQQTVIPGNITITETISHAFPPNLSTPNTPNIFGNDLYYSQGTNCAKKVQELLKEHGKLVVSLGIQKAQQKCIVNRWMAVAAGDASNKNDKARDAACSLKVDSDSYYAEITSGIASCEEKLESLKADIVYYKLLALYNLAMIGMHDAANVFWNG